jgi:hypothetical protein
MYEKAIVSFIDILGFRELIHRSKAEEVKAVLDFLHKFAKPQIENEEDYFFEAEAISFSDCVIRVRKIEKRSNSKYPLGLVYYELNDLLLAQMMLIYDGVLLRGGIAYGDIYFDGEHIYGSALNKAYELEAYYAVYPRIVLSPNLINEVKVNHLLKDENHTHQQELDLINNYILQGEDGLWFLNYIDIRNLANPDSLPDYLLAHKKIICEGAQGLSYMSKRLSKYLWMAKYHNDFVQALSDNFFTDFNPNRKFFKISAEDLPMLQDLILENLP